MNRTKLKNYAPQARRDFIQAMTDRAAFYGLTPTKTEPVVERGDVAVIAGREHPRAVAKKRKLLEDRIQRHEFEPTMEALAYTWFNRLVAIRFMELHGYFDHGYRVLSHPEGKPTPEILEHAEHVELPGLKKERVIDLKLAGNKDGELYRLLLTAQCNALHTAMPFLFERIDDETELLLPDNLIHSDSLIRKLVGEIDEEDWKEVEIIGWLYQFYISDKKDEVIGQVVASEDIPAATQLFTPNWIVKYLVQNTLGRQWLATYPQSALRQQMAYYIEPAEQTPEVQAQLKAITPTSLNPEELTLLDPACGSGHILVEGYDLFKAIYTERGYNKREIPRLILEKNLFGLEIDDRAAQLAAFALMMKARADDRRIFDSGVKPNVLAFQDSQGMNAADITDALNSPIDKEDVPSEYLFEEVQEEKDGLFSKKALAEKGHVSPTDIASLLALFENAKTFGSLIQVPPKLAAKLPEIDLRLDDVLKHGDLTHASAHVLKPLLQQARLLARQYDAVVANPPYMDKGMNGTVKEYVGKHYSDGKANLFSAFMIRSFAFVTGNGFNGMVTMQSWMFLRSYSELRKSILTEKALVTMAHLGPRAFPSISGEVVQTTAFACQNVFLHGYTPTFFRLVNGDDEYKDKALQERNLAFAHVAQEDFLTLPDCPIAYWVPGEVRHAFAAYPPLASVGEPRMGMATGSNARHVRLWHEVSIQRIGFGCKDRTESKATGCKWFPYNKGGEYRRWYGNHDCVVNWSDDGKLLQTLKHTSGRIWAHNFNLDYIFKPCLSWSDLGSKKLSFRYFPPGFLFDAAGLSAFFRSHTDALAALGLLNSRFVQFVSEVLNPTMHFQPGDCGRIPFSPAVSTEQVCGVVEEAIQLAKRDWESAETAWDFCLCPLLANRESIHEALADWMQKCNEAIDRMCHIETLNDKLVRQCYGLKNGVGPELQKEDITLYRPDREEDIKRLISYAIGCMMGRYSLDKPGLVYAHSGNQGFDHDQYKTFRADDDGIIPLLESDWGIRDDATSRFVVFGAVAWPKEHLEENLKFVADSLDTTTGEQPRDTIRRYLATGFYKHHLSMYKKRPIYWLFSSGKLRAFQCLVYLHRYNEGTLARMRTEYVIPLQGQIAARIDQLEGDKAKATSSSHRKKLQKEQDDLKKQQAELLIFEEKLKHAADQKIVLDLDDGVKVNYGKFGDLLAESRAIADKD